MARRRKHRTHHHHRRHHNPKIHWGEIFLWGAVGVGATYMYMNYKYTLTPRAALTA